MNTRRIKLSTDEKIVLMSNLATMLSAGIPILETIDSLLEDSKGNTKKFLEVLREEVTQGKNVHSAVEKFPAIFDKVTVNILRGAEEAGTLDVTLNDIKENIKKEAEFVDKIKGALTYPILIFFVFIGVFLIILTFVVPKISTVFLRLKVPLPLPTQILIFLSDFILKNTIIMIISTIGVTVLFVLLYNTRRRNVQDIIFSLPLVSRLILEIDLIRFSHSMYMLLDSGLPITSSLELCQEVVHKRDLQKAIAHSKELVMSGKKLSEGFKSARNVFPSIMIKITEAGEKTGSLDKSMKEISEFLNYQVDGTLKTITTLLEPLMLVFVGILIGGMMLSIIAPIYGLISQIGVHP